MQSIGLCVLMLLFSGALGQLLDINDIKEEVLRNVMECASDNHVLIGDMITTTQNVITSKNDNNNNTKCFMFCILNRFNVMDDNGDFLTDLLKFGTQLIPMAAIKNTILDNIDPIVIESSINSDPCERAFLFLQISYKKFTSNPNLQAVFTLAKSAVTKLGGRLMSRVSGGK